MWEEGGEVEVPVEGTERSRNGRHAALGGEVLEPCVTRELDLETGERDMDPQLPK